MRCLNLFIFRNGLFLTYFLFLSSCDTIVSKYQTYQRINHNPYLNFYESIDCQCGKKEIVSPQLKFIKKINVYKNEKDIQTIVVSSESSLENKNIYIKYDINKCGIINFNLNDLVIIKGEMFFESSNYIIEPLNGYIQLNGKKHCVE